jgi:hypothetical protein
MAGSRCWFDATKRKAGKIDSDSIDWAKTQGTKT